MLKSQIHIFADGEGWQPTFDAESINAKIPHSHFFTGRVGCQLLMLSTEMLKSQIYIFVGGGGVGGQLLMLSPQMLKSQILIFAGVEGWWSTFDAQSKNAKKSKIHIFTGRRGGLAANF